MVGLSDDLEKVQITNDFCIYYDRRHFQNKLSNLGFNLQEKINQMIWNHAYDNNNKNYYDCGEGQFKVFRIKSPKIEFTYADFGSYWIFYDMDSYE